MELMSVFGICIIFILAVEVCFWSFSINRHAIWLINHPYYDRRLAVPAKVLSFAGWMTALLAISLWIWHVRAFSLHNISQMDTIEFYGKTFLTSWVLLSMIHMWGIVSRYACLHSSYWPIISGKISDFIVRKLGMTEINKYCSTLRKWNELDRLSEQHKQLLFKFADKMNDYIWTKDQYGKYTYVNESLANEILLMDSLDVVGMSHNEIGDCNRNAGITYSFDNAITNSDNVVIEKKVNLHFILRGIINDLPIAVKVTKSPIFIDGQVVGIIGIGRDITYEIDTMDQFEILLKTNKIEEAKNLFTEFKSYITTIS